MRGCLDGDQLAAYLADVLPTAASAALEAHTEHCRRCRRLLRNAAAADTTLGLAWTPHPPQPLPAALRPLLARQPRTTHTGPDGPAAGRGPAPPWPELPDYEIERELGRGGMGVVYLARDRRLQRPVAVKVMLNGRYASAEERARFRAEALLVAQLGHPHLVKVFHVGEQDGLPFCVMEYVEGGNLRQRLAGRPLPPREAARLLAQVAAALQAVHAAGVVHRDLKPDNVLLTADGFPRVTDFGLARRLDGSTLTRAGQLMGTPCYMAPEQASGHSRETGPAVDVYALGALLYELLTGCPPFQGASDAQTLAQILAQEPVPPRRLVPGLPADLETVCLHCLQKEPARRYASAGDLEADLRRFLTGQPVQARPVGPAMRLWRACRRRPLRAAGAAAVFLLTALAVGGPLTAYRQAAEAQAQVARTRQALDELLPGLEEDLRSCRGVFPARQKALRLARVYALGVPLAADAGRQQAYADRAVQLLAQAHDAGLFRAAADVERLRGDPAFQALAAFPSFREFLRTLEARGPRT